MNIEELYKLYQKYFLVVTDTRKIKKNTIFFALKGSKFNGNKYAKEALDKGAIYAVVDEKEYATSEQIILVDDVLKTLQELAKFHRRILGIKIIGLTGSNGKTTTKELINAVLSKKYKTTATLGNLNNHIGVPLTLLSMTNKTEIGIVEMGANHPDEIAFLASIANPDFGYITNFGKAHLEGFGSVEGVIKSKSELYNYLKLHDKTIFVNPNDPIQVKKTNTAKRVLFENIDFIEVNPFVKLAYKTIEIQSNLIGEYNFNNISAAISIGNYFDISLDEIKNAIENYTPTNNRSQIIEKGTNQLILDAYNANPSSMEVALKNFKLIGAKQRVVILGDMFELGTTSSEEHQNITDLVSKLEFDKTFLVGEHFFKTKTNLQTHLHKFKSYKDLSTHLKQNPIENSYILIKGSRGMALERVLTVFSLCSLCDERQDCL